MVDWPIWVCMGPFIADMCIMQTVASNRGSNYNRRGAGGAGWPIAAIEKMEKTELGWIFVTISAHGFLALSEQSESVFVIGLVSTQGSLCVCLCVSVRSCLHPCTYLSERELCSPSSILLLCCYINIADAASVSFCQR